MPPPQESIICPPCVTDLFESHCLQHGWHQKPVVADGHDYALDAKTYDPHPFSYSFPRRGWWLLACRARQRTSEYLGPHCLLMLLYIDRLRTVVDSTLGVLVVP